MAAIQAMMAGMRDFTEDDYEMLLGLDDNAAKTKGLSRSDIDSMPTNIYEAPRDGSPIPSCTICMDEFVPGKSVVRRLHCLHFFCKDCVDQWLAKAPTCPVCKHNMRST